MSLFTNKTLMITGGTGSFGSGFEPLPKTGYRRDPDFFPCDERSRTTCGMNIRQRCRK